MSELLTIRQVFTQGEEYRAEIKKVGEDSYNELTSICNEYKMEVDNKYNLTKTDMNSRIDGCKESFVKSYSEYIKLLNTKGLAFISSIDGEYNKYLNIINNTTGTYPLSNKLKGILASNIPMKKHIKFKLPISNCIFYVDYRKSVNGYDYKNGFNVNVKGDKFIGLNDGIIYSEDKQLYCQKLFGRGVWFGIGTENTVHSWKDFGPHGSNPDKNTITKTILSNDQMFSFQSSGGKPIGELPGAIARFFIYPNISDTFIYFSSDINSSIQGLSTRANMDYSKYYIPLYASPISAFRVHKSSIYSKDIDAGSAIFWLNHNITDVTVQWSYIQCEYNEIATPFVNKTREHSKIYYPNILNRKSIIIKCEKLNPLNKTFLLFEDKDIRIIGYKNIREFFNREKDNVLIINFLQKKIYVNGVEIERDLYWTIEQDSIGIIVDENVEDTELSRKLYMNDTLSKELFKGVTVNESLEDTELIRRGDSI